MSKVNPPAREHIITPWGTPEILLHIWGTRGTALQTLCVLPLGQKHRPPSGMPPWPLMPHGLLGHLCQLYVAPGIIQLAPGAPIPMPARNGKAGGTPVHQRPDLGRVPGLSHLHAGSVSSRATAAAPGPASPSCSSECGMPLCPGASFTPACFISHTPNTALCTRCDPRPLLTTEQPCLLPLPPKDGRWPLQQDCKISARARAGARRTA